MESLVNIGERQVYYPALIIRELDKAFAELKEVSFERQMEWYKFMLAELYYSSKVLWSRAEAECDKAWLAMPALTTTHLDKPRTKTYISKQLYSYNVAEEIKCLKDKVEWRRS